VDLYSLVVESFTIHDTRSAHEDTLWLNFSTFVDDDMVDSWSTPKKLGDYNNGTYYTPASVRNHPPIVINDRRSKVAFIFQLVNNGNADAGVFNARVAATADQLAGIVSGLAGAGAQSMGEVLGGPVFWAAIALEGFANLWAWLSTDCDGPVAVDQVSGPRYWIDELTDNVAHSISVTKKYRGGDMPQPCGNSNYDVTWYLRHDRTWTPIADAAQTQLTSLAGVGAAEHNGMLHCFGVGAGGSTATHAVTLTGASWTVDYIPDYVLAPDLAPSPVSFDDRLHVFGVAGNGAVVAFTYTIDGASWYDEPGSPPELKTNQAIATVGFLDRLYVFARDQITNQLSVTSSSDLRIWVPWAAVPAGGPLAPQSAVAAAALNGTLHLFGISEFRKRVAVVHTSTNDGQTWANWEIVEGLPPEGEPAAAEPLDVTAGIYHRRVYVGARWETVDASGQTTTSMGLNFSGDGDNWSGWRVPETFAFGGVSDFEPSASPALAAVHNHLYIISPSQASGSGTPQVWAY
jgi:hypothetical protein